MSEEIKSSPELAKFFKRLLDLKQYIKDAAENNEDPQLLDIYTKLDEIIKEKE